MSRLDRYRAFSDTQEGGNPAGVVLDARDLADEDMQRIAADVGYSESAFLTTPITERAPIRVRYFSPEGEVDFCGHATIATAVALGETYGPGSYTLTSNAGVIDISSRRDESGTVGTLDSPAVDCLPLDGVLLDQLLAALRWTHADLDPTYPPAVGFGGNKHPVLVLRDLERLGHLDYDFAALQQLCRAQTWITIQAVVPTSPAHWRARDPFAWGGVVEDPATGAAAAALVGYLRAHRRLAAEETIVITQGVEMGRPSTIHATLHEDLARISGHATRITRG
ncbi:PhzF family phenazine biosynthesis protein [Tsukamurella soli]|uniref:PhzF family phenazine biosynthesis isomerase n=1 Tax=Tsukamurella soli TaxID=644556 RepID=A0ABP8J1D0_9ACTN